MDKGRLGRWFAPGSRKRWEADSMSEMRVIGIRVEQPQNQPVLLLKETDGDRYLPIWIGQPEATAIVLEQQGVEPARPLTHDLIKNLITALGHTLREVRIVDLQEGTFYADLVFEDDLRLSARPSDSVAIALRVGVPIYAEEAVLDEAGLVMPDEREDEVEKFKEFLESVSPDDFKATDG
jgi:bifunctional DNase/RNase